MSQPDSTSSAELLAEVPRLRALARCVVRDDDPDDVAQQAVLAALTQPTRPRSLRRWLAQVVRNEHRARSRGRARRRAREAHGVGPEAMPDPEEELARAQLIEALREVVHELDEPYRAVLVARFFEDRCAAEIARAQDCPAATVRWRMQEALRRTRRKLDQRFHGRQQWFGGMAVVGFPFDPPLMGLSSGVSKMKTYALVKAIATAAVVGTAAAAVVVTIGTDVTASSNRRFLPPDSALEMVSRDLPRVGASAIPTAMGSIEADEHDEYDHDRAPSCADHPECAGPPISSHVLQDCFASAGLALGESMNAVLHLGEGNATGRIIERVEVLTLEDVEIADASACLTSALGGSSLQLPGLDDQVRSVALSLVGDGKGAPTMDTPQWPTDADAPDPVQAVVVLGLPRRGPVSAKVAIVE